MPSPKLKTSVTEERLWVFLDIFDDMKKVNIISLGCSKNLVDTEMLLKQLDQAGYDTETDVENSDAEVVIVNTCGFIGDSAYSNSPAKYKAEMQTLENQIIQNL